MTTASTVNSVPFGALPGLRNTALGLFAVVLTSLGHTGTPQAESTTRAARNAYKTPLQEALAPERLYEYPPRAKSVRYVNDLNDTNYHYVLVQEDPRLGKEMVGGEYSKAKELPWHLHETVARTGNWVVPYHVSGNVSKQIVTLAGGEIVEDRIPDKHLYQAFPIKLEDAIAKLKLDKVKTVTYQPVSQTYELTLKTGQRLTAAKTWTGESLLPLKTLAQAKLPHHQAGIPETEIIIPDAKAFMDRVKTGPVSDWAVRTVSNPNSKGPDEDKISYFKVRSGGTVYYHPLPANEKGHTDETGRWQPSGLRTPAFKAVQDMAARLQAKVSPEMVLAPPKLKLESAWFQSPHTPSHSGYSETFEIAQANQPKLEFFHLQDDLSTTWMNPRAMEKDPKKIDKGIDLNAAKSLIPDLKAVEFYPISRHFHLVQKDGKVLTISRDTLDQAQWDIAKADQKALIEALDTKQPLPEINKRLAVEEFKDAVRAANIPVMDAPNEKILDSVDAFLKAAKTAEAKSWSIPDQSHHIQLHTTTNKTYQILVPDDAGEADRLISTLIGLSQKGKLTAAVSGIRRGYVDGQLDNMWLTYRHSLNGGEYILSWPPFGGGGKIIEMKPF